jgi:broad specificity phosphatase PhoE
MGSLFLIRHGQASFGTEDYDRLSPLGTRQARLAGRYLQRATQNVSRIICGSLTRQKDTATEIARCLNSRYPDLPPVQFDLRLHELDADAQIAGILPRLDDPDGELAALAANMNVSARSYQLVLKRVFLHWQTMVEIPEKIETWGAFSARVGALLDDLKRDSRPGETTIVVTSGGVIATAAQQVLELPPQAAYPLLEMMMNCSVTHLLHDRGRFTLSSFNECSYLWFDEQGSADPKLLTYR